MPQRILVVDDDKQIARLIRSYLEQAGYQVLVAYDGETALHALRRESPDLVVLDLMLPDRDGWDITRTVRSDPALAATPIIMVTARVEDTDKIVGLELGADDYVTKPFNPRELVSRVRAVLRRMSGQPALVSPVLNAGALQLDPDKHEARLDGQLLDLTPTEFDLLRALMANPGHAFTRGELIEQALGYTYEGLERTVDSHIKNLRRKIETDPGNPVYLQTVYGVGYRFVGEGEG
ncbi:MAG: response regulator transcription factor [Anaerolineae bacterium]|nr:response regulator transcription factor [Anaerolineae bacterium]MCB0206292.1 response regulator transcription factor [Anaerolineae bacterium]MCB0256502.1 response regulator transcription factor [Anaerolineae bacterium]